MIGSLLLLGIAVAVLIYVFAVASSRRGRSAAHAAAFWSGIAGLVTLPMAILATVAALPFVVVGAGDHPLGWIVPTAWAVLALLAVVSLAATLVARRGPATVSG